MKKIHQAEQWLVVLRQEKEKIKEGAFGSMAAKDYESKAGAIGGLLGDSDVWVEWGAQLRDVMIVDEQNQLVETINLTLYDLADTSNYDSLRDKIIGADSGEGELTLESDWRAGSEIEETIDTLAQFFNR